MNIKILQFETEEFLVWSSFDYKFEHWAVNQNSKPLISNFKPLKSLAPEKSRIYGTSRTFDIIRASMIEVEELTRKYGSFTALDRLSFRVKPGEVLGLVGPNGAGKTTTLRCIVGIIPPTRGDIRISGFSMVSEPLPAKRRIAFMPDEPRLFEHLTVIEHLQFTARIYGVADSEKKTAVLLDELELSERRDALPNELSRGMKQKLVIACGLLHEPENLLFDEPLTGLDPVGIRRMKRTILERARRGTSVIVSSHLLHMIEEICDTILILKGGKKVIQGSLSEISNSMPELKGDLSLEEIFIHLTGTDEGTGQ